MKKTVFLLAGLFLTTFSAFSQISSLPYEQGFETEFTTGTNVSFLPNWTGNDVAETNRIFKDNVVFNQGTAAMSVVPTGSFDGNIQVSLDLTNYTNVSVALSAKSMANGTGSRPAALIMSTSIDGGANWGNVIEIGSFPNENQESFAEFTYNLPETTNNNATVLVRFVVATGNGGSGTRAKLVIDDVEITGTEGVSESAVLTLTPEALSFSQTLGTSSDAQSVTVIGSNLTENIGLTVTAPFEVALTEDGEYALTQTLSLTDGGFSGSVFVRLNATEATTFTGTFTAQTAGIDSNVEVTLQGEAFEPVVLEISNPAPFNLSTGNYLFTEWAATSEAGTYPNNMMLWINAAGDGVESTITDEYVQNWECGYEVSAASRFLGEGENGLAFLNTGNTVTNANCYGTEQEGRIIGKPGAVVLALNTLGRENIVVGWTGKTLTPNNRVYALRLQYRIGNGEGNANLGWTDFETVSEYLRNEIEGHSQELTVNLPEVAENQELVQLRWVYFQHESNTASGSRAKLALDEVSVSSEATASVGEFEVNTFRMYPNPATSVVNFNKEVTATIFDITGKKVLSAENTSSVNVSTLNKGIYVVKTTEGNVSKLVIK